MLLPLFFVSHRRREKRWRGGNPGPARRGKMERPDFLPSPAKERSPPSSSRPYYAAPVVVNVRSKTVQEIDIFDCCTSWMKCHVKRTFPYFLSLPRCLFDSPRLVTRCLLFPTGNPVSPVENRGGRRRPCFPETFAAWNIGSGIRVSFP